MKSVVTLLIFALNVVVATGARAADADDEDKSVLGGSPPIYVSAPVTGPIQVYRSNRHIPSGRPAGEVCAGMDANGSLVRGQVVADGTGKFCATREGTFGPGPEQPIGLPCKVETEAGFVQGQISDTAR
jgi:hypothetical protein